MVTRALACSVLLALSLSGQTARLPSAQPLFVWQGGDTPNVNYHMAISSQAYAVDFAVVGGAGGRELSRPQPTRAEDFFCWDTAVLSPTPGRVVAIVNTLPDNTLGAKDAAHPLGNHVVIQAGDRFFYVAHLRQRSLSVQVGDSVWAGTVLGRCVNSGNTDFPHIHVHATHSAVFGEGVGINVTYGPMHVSLAGKEFTNVEWPLLRGLWVHAP